MRLGVILPPEEQKHQAGVRIRYERIKPALQALGHDLEFIPIQNLVSTSKPMHDIYLISKCYDARAIMVAQQLQAQGVNVGVDLFDDYFSQLSDSRFGRLRYWLRTLLPYCSFVLCSTTGMRDIVKNYGSNLPVHVMNDPAMPFDAQILAETLARKLHIAQQQRRIDVSWFGIGDNPYFPVGLADLIAFGCEVDRLRGFGFEVNLTILTNRRAMTVDNLARLRKLATPYQIEEWTDEREASLLARSLVSFLPVNAQSFSRVKSLNRAITALTSGTQVLSSGYPLYKLLDQFIYRCSRQLIADLKRGELSLRESTVTQFCEQARQLADADAESKALIDFLVGLKPSQQLVYQTNAIFAVIHGNEMLVDSHKFAQKKNMLSVASPLCKLELNFDVRFRYNQQGELVVLISKKKICLIDARLTSMLNSPIKLLNTEYLVLDVLKVFPDVSVSGHALILLDTPVAYAAVYPVIMGCVTDILQRIFLGINWVVLERSTQIPWVISKRLGFEVVQ